MNMKVRCIDPGKHSALLKGEIYDGELINNDIIEEKRWKIKGHEHMSYFESRFEIVKDNKMEKTLLEIIKDGFNNKVYVDKDNNTVYVASNNQLIFNYNKEKRITHAICTEVLDLNVKYKLERKEYSFDEAFKAYEEGKEIESCENGYKYLQNTFTYPGNEQWLCFRNSEQMFTTEAIRGKWYIND